MIESLLRLLDIAPVMGNIHPLWTLCVPADVEILTSARTLAERLDGIDRHTEQPILITDYDLTYTDRFLHVHLPDSPPPELINQSLPMRIAVESHLLRQKDIGQRIASDTRSRGYDAVVLMLIDGLCYEDVKHWPYHPMPCLVDGPSITFARTDTGVIVPDVGFPGIVGSVSIARQLAQVGISRSRGYSYWNREQNDVSAFLFSGMPLERVSGTREAIDYLREINLKGMYVQIVREGTDGLAHSRREVTQTEVQATVSAILKDFQQIIDLLLRDGLRGAVYLISDHGILWKYQHQIQPLEYEKSSHVRYTWETPKDMSHVHVSQTSNGPCYLYLYPHGGRVLRANDSGTHGGLSYWESIVPFIHVEVNT